MELVRGNIFIREFVFAKAGESCEIHNHNFDHCSYIVTGAAQIDELRPTKFIKEEHDDPLTRERILVDVPVEFEVLRSVDKEAGGSVLVKAKSWHRITALRDGTKYQCIFSHRDPQTGEVVQDWNGWPGANH